MEVFRNVIVIYGDWTVFLTTDAYVVIKDTNTGRIYYRKYAPKCSRKEHLMKYIKDYQSFLKEVEMMRRGELYEQSTIH